MQIARVIGGLFTLVTGARAYRSYVEQGHSEARSAVFTAIGFDIEGTDNDIPSITARLGATYWPAILGEAAHQALGNPRGAFNTGLGMKLNRHTPKGLNL